VFLRYLISAIRREKPTMIATTSNLPPLVNCKLGRKPAVASKQSRLLKVPKYLNLVALPPAPATVSWQNAITQWQMLGNDTAGDCVVACSAHLQMGWAANSGNPPVVVTDAQAMALYSQLTGYDPSTGANDTGLVITDYLDLWRSSGVFGNKIGAYVSLHEGDGNTPQPWNHSILMASIWLFGGVMAGVNLPKAWEGATTWTAPSRAHRFFGWAPGSWGGHCVPMIGYDAQNVYVVSWGVVVPVTWAAIDMYFTEGYASIDPLWLSVAGVAPSGFDAATLVNDLPAVAA
jgi:hypothetical protein